MNILSNIAELKFLMEENSNLRRRNQDINKKLKDALLMSEEQIAALDDMILRKWSNVPH